MPEKSLSPTAHAGPITDWPRPIPVRLCPPPGDPTRGEEDELLVTILGDVATPLADGVFDPIADRVTLHDGTVIEDYYKAHLGITHYEPMDKGVFPLPPSGWCSWYFYYMEVDPGEVLANARWIADHLAEYGCRVVQLDDGWQGVGHGMGDNRDWTTIDDRFAGLGMEGLAGEIRSLGLTPGLWLAPHGQSNEAVAREAGAFLFDEAGQSVSETWEGDFLLDPTSPNTPGYLRDLFTRLRGWGYRYFKIDGQPIVLDEYEKHADAFVEPPPEGVDRKAYVAQRYRDTLGVIREAIGPESYLLGCWGTPLPATGLVDGSRTGPDIVQGLPGLLTAVDATASWNFMHNIAWYCDPDVLMVREPLAIGIARAWATIQGLTGQALLTSDRLTDLSQPRVELLRRVYPAVDIRPLDLFKPDDPRKPVWDLKVSHLGRSYDVVGLFNFHDDKARTRFLGWAEIGLEADGLHHVYDFWRREYLGCWEAGVFVEVPPADVRVLTVVPAEDRPVLISTSRHITQGWVDLLELEHGGTEDRPVLAGRSRMIGGDPYTLTIGLPRSSPTWRLADVRLDADQPVRCTHASHQGWATLTLRSDVTQEVSWCLEFEPADGEEAGDGGGVFVFPVSPPERITVETKGVHCAVVTWPAPYHPQAGFCVELDGERVGVAFHTRVVLRHLEPGRSYVAGVRSVWTDGSVSERTAEARFTMPEA
jgi:hypothetical protein